MSRQIIYAGLVFLTSISAIAQQDDSEKTVLYVTDQLRLSLYEQADAQSKVISYLSSGDRLVVEEVAGPYAKVTVPSGKRGWVKRGFLLSEPTANLLLKDMTETNNLLKKEMEKLNNSKVILNQYEKDMDAMGSKIEALEQQKISAEATINELEQAAEEKIRAEKARPALASLKKIAISYWHYIALTVLSILLFGFLVGKSSAERAIKRKFQGIKVW